MLDWSHTITNLLTGRILRIPSDVITKRQIHTVSDNLIIHFNTYIILKVYLESILRLLKNTFFQKGII